MFPSDRQIIFGALIATATLALPAQAQTAVPPPPGLTGWWSACDPLGTFDPKVHSIGPGPDGVALNGVQSVPGIVGNSFEFDGPTEYVEIPTNESLSDDFTIEMWVYWDPSINPDGRNYILADTEGLEDRDSNFFAGFALMTNTLGNWHLHFSKTALFPSPLQTLPTKRWTHLAVVKERDLLTYYMTDPCTPNQPQIGTSGLFEPFTNAGSTLWLGGLPSYPGHFFGGRIDEPSIYDRPLTQQEIAAIVQAKGAGKIQPAGVACAPGCWSSISGRLFYDVNGDAQWNAFEPVFITRIVRLYCGTDLIDIVLSDLGGRYTFPVVPPGNYTVRTSYFIPTTLANAVWSVWSGFVCTSPTPCSHDVVADCAPITDLDFAYERGSPALVFEATKIATVATAIFPQ